jgi:hypothetical protein
MAFEELEQNTDNIRTETHAYIESNLAYYKLKSFKVAMKSTTLILKITLMVLFLLMVLLFCSIAGAFAIGTYLGSNALGFLSVGGIYLLFTLLVFLFKDKIIEGPILEKFSEIFFND